jgi:hypothetical protein
VFINVLHIVPALLNLDAASAQRRDKFYQRWVEVEKIFSR